MKKKLKRKLRKAMTLPFDEAVLIVRKATCEDYTIAFRKDVSEWCVRHATELQKWIDSESYK